MSSRSLLVFLLGGLALGPACAGKNQPRAPEARVKDSIPERTAASRAASTRGGSDQDEERFGHEAARAHREAHKPPPSDGRHVDVVESGGSGKPSRSTPPR
jgi:hypothetical protein